MPPAEARIRDIALRAAQCALFQRRRGVADSTRSLYTRAHSLLRALRRHLALLDERMPAA